MEADLNVAEGTGRNTRHAVAGVTDMFAEY